MNRYEFTIERDDVESDADYEFELSRNAVEEFAIDAYDVRVTRDDKITATIEVTMSDEHARAFVNETMGYGTIGFRIVG